jgi:hypothetical protein
VKRVIGYANDSRNLGQLGAIAERRPKGWYISIFSRDPIPVQGSFVGPWSREELRSIFGFIGRRFQQMWLVS